MKRRHILISVAVAASVVAANAVHAADDRLALKSPNGIEFSEFKGYETWQMIAPSLADDSGGCGSSKTGCIKTILGNAAMIAAFKAGIPANGKPVPDGATMAKIEWETDRNGDAPYGVSVPGKLMEVAFMTKDAKRFPDTNGWGYATLKYDAAADTWKPHGKDASFAKTCHMCHAAGAKERDFVYTDFPKR
jgi:hypothetical protein